MKRVFRSSRNAADQDSSQTATTASSLAKPATTSSPPALPSDSPVTAQLGGGHFVVGGGVAIFHLATERVVVCHHTKRGYWFLPKGRRDVLEDSGRGAEREGFEESGYRNRLLPLPLTHRQPLPHHPASTHARPYSCEPVWTSLSPLKRDVQYILHWYIAETLPPDLEHSLASAEARSKALSSTDEAVYQAPPPFPQDLSLKERMQMEDDGYEPPRHQGTSIQEDELHYMSYLLPVTEAIEKLKDVPVSVEVIRRGWEGIQRRQKMEADQRGSL